MIPWDRLITAGGAAGALVVARMGRLCCSSRPLMSPCCSCSGRHPAPTPLSCCPLRRPGSSAAWCPGGPAAGEMRIGREAPGPNGDPAGGAAPPDCRERPQGPPDPSIASPWLLAMVGHPAGPRSPSLLLHAPLRQFRVLRWDRSPGPPGPPASAGCPAFTAAAEGRAERSPSAAAPWDVRASRRHQRQPGGHTGARHSEAGHHIGEAQAPTPPHLLLLAERHLGQSVRGQQQAHREEAERGHGSRLAARLRCGPVWTSGCKFGPVHRALCSAPWHSSLTAREWPHC